MALQQKIPVLAPEAIASYDFFDFASSIGYKAIYLVGFRTTGSAVRYGLTTDSSLHSHQDGVDIIADAAATDTDMDFEFQKVMIVEGTLFFSFEVGLQNSGGSPASTAVNLGVTIIHYDGSTETTIGSTKTVTADGGSLASGGKTFVSVAEEIDITRTKFKPGEKLRLNVTITSPGTSRQAYLGSDPGNRTGLPFGSGTPADFKNSRIIVPFKVLQ